MCLFQSFLVNLGLAKPKQKQESLTNEDTSASCTSTGVDPDTEHRSTKGEEQVSEKEASKKDEEISEKAVTENLAEVAANALAAAKSALSSNFSSQVGKIKVR